MERVLVADLSPNVSWTGKFYNPSVVLSLKNIQRLSSTFDLNSSIVPYQFHIFSQDCRGIFLLASENQRLLHLPAEPRKKKCGLPGQLQILAIFHSHLQLKRLDRLYDSPRTQFRSLTGNDQHHLQTIESTSVFTNCKMELGSLSILQSI